MIYLYSFLNHTSEVPAHSLSKYYWIFNWPPPPNHHMARQAPTLAMAFSLSRFPDHTLRHTPQSVGLLWTCDQPHHRDLYLTTHNTHSRQTSMPPVGFEPAFPSSKTTDPCDGQRCFLWGKTRSLKSFLYERLYFSDIFEIKWASKK